MFVYMNIYIYMCVYMSAVCMSLDKALLFMYYAISCVSVWNISVDALCDGIENMNRVSYWDDVSCLPHSFLWRQRINHCHQNSLYIYIKYGSQQYNFDSILSRHVYHCRFRSWRVLNDFGIVIQFKKNRSWKLNWNGIFPCLNLSNHNTQIQRQILSWQCLWALIYFLFVKKML